MPRDQSLPRQTGRWRVRARLPFGLCKVVEVETSRMVFRPIYSGHTPANWVEERRWREAGEHDRFEVEVGWP